MEEKQGDRLSQYVPIIRMATDENIKSFVSSHSRSRLAEALAFYGVLAQQKCGFLEGQHSS